MAKTMAAALDRVMEKLRDAGSGVQAQISAIAGRDRVRLNAVSPLNLKLLNAPADLLDQMLTTTYPQVLVFGQQLENAHKEKFASFSGRLQVGIDVRISSESLDGLEADLHRYVEAVTGALHAGPAEWAVGLTYSDRYAVTYAPARVAGPKFLQSARISFALDLYVK